MVLPKVQLLSGKATTMMGANFQEPHISATLHKRIPSVKAALTIIEVATMSEEEAPMKEILTQE